MQSDFNTLITNDFETSEILRRQFEKTHHMNKGCIALSAIPVPDGIHYIRGVGVSELTVFKQFRKFKTKKSLSPEGIPAIFFKTAALGLTIPMSILFRKFIDEARTPEVHKEALIAPIPKAGRKTDVRIQEHTTSFANCSLMQATRTHSDRRHSDKRRNPRVNHARSIRLPQK